MKSPWCSLLIRVFPISDHMRPIRHKRQHKLKQCPIHMKGQANLGGRGGGGTD